MNRKILIIGGGIGGLMTAIALNKKGIASIVCEKSASFDEVGAGIVLWPNATRILDKLELLEKLLSRGNVLREMKTSTSKGRYLSTVKIQKLEEKFHYPSIVLRRADLQKELLNAIHSSQINYNKQFIKIEEKLTNLRVHFNDGSSEDAEAVIFADGINSLARKSIFNYPPLKYAGRTSWRGIAQFHDPHSKGNTSYEILGRGKRVGIFQLEGNKAYWYAAVNMPEGEALKQKRTIECVLSHFKNWPEQVRSTLENTAENRLILTSINYSNGINRLVKGNMALLGDAAHPMTPDLGQGACQAIEDAFVLAECLSKDISISESLLHYEKIRLGRVRHVASGSFRIGNFRQLESSAGLFVRNSLFRVMPEYFALKMLARYIKTG